MVVRFLAKNLYGNQNSKVKKTPKFFLIANSQIKLKNLIILKNILRLQRML